MWRCRYVFEMGVSFSSDKYPEVELLDHVVVIYLFKETLYCFPGEGNGTPLQYSCLENPMDRGAWWAAVHGVAKSQA